MHRPSTLPESSGRRDLAPLAWFLVALFVLWSVRATVMMPIDERIPSEALRLLYSNALKLVIWVLPSWWMARQAEPEHPFRYLGITTPVRWPRLAVAVLLALLYLAGILAWEGAFSGKNVGILLHLSFSDWYSALLVVFPSAVIEEILFRGLVLHELSARLDFRSANLLTALLFVAIHWPNWLWMYGYQPWMPITALAIFLLALMLGLLVRITGSIWPSAGMHIANNLIARLVGL